MSISRTSHRQESEVSGQVPGKQDWNAGYCSLGKRPSHNQNRETFQTSVTTANKQRAHITLDSGGRVTVKLLPASPSQWAIPLN